MKKILVPIDFSKNSRHALDFAIEFNELIKGEIVLIHVLDLPITQHGYIGLATQANLEVYYGKKVINKTQDQLAGWAQTVSSTGQMVSTILKYGNPYEGISKSISAEDADWIVMGSKGASGLKDIFIGSNAERVVRFAKSPVIVIKGETHVDEIRSIVLATDGTESGEKLIAKVKQIQQALNLKIHLLKVRTYSHESEEKDQDILHEFARHFQLKNYTLNSIEAPYPDEGIVKFAEQIHSGLIAIGTHGHTGFMHLFGGSWAEDVVNESGIPVMSVQIGQV